MAKRIKSVQELREHAEAALESASRRTESLLAELASRAEAGSEDAIFAHRHLAELCLEDNPWQAALYLRQVIKHQPDDDVLHALTALCHALMGNYRVAVRSYRTATILSPNTPWYHHNLGHLTDVALGQPERAHRHLRRAYVLEPDHDEILASLAHCLARLGQRKEAREFAELAREKGPRNPDHDALLNWIDAGTTDTPAAPPVKTTTRDVSDHVLQLVQLHMRKAGYSRSEIERAKRMWSDVQRTERLRVRKPEVFAAALEYTVNQLYSSSAVSRAEVARRYGVAPASVAHRCTQLRSLLQLEPRDPRHAGSR